MAKHTTKYFKISESDLRKALRRINESRIEEIIEKEIKHHEQHMDLLFDESKDVFEYEDYDDICDNRMMQLYRNSQYQKPKQID